MDRKSFLKSFSIATGMLASAGAISMGRSRKSIFPSVKASRVLPGDVAAIVSPAGSVVSNDDIQTAVNEVTKLGLRPKLGKNLGERWGYLGGHDTQRLTDLHDAFSDPEVKVIFPIRGGYGTSRLLPMLDFELIRNNPKAFIGFSDNTSLVLAMNQFAGLVTFYGPNALFEWTNYTQKNWRKILMDNNSLGPFALPDLSVVHSEEYMQPFTVVKGQAQGSLIGGNLSLIIQTLGTEWEIDTRDKILFFEDVNESPYRIDRMLTHLWLARKLQVAAGFAIGQITKSNSVNALDLEAVIRDRFEPLGKPCFAGLPTGHINNILTLPLGVNVRLNAEAHRLSLVESAVV